MVTNPYVDKNEVVRTVKKIQRKYFSGRWNHEVLAICCALLADEIAEAEEVDWEKMFDDLVRVIKQHVRLTKQERTGLQ